MEKLDKNEYDKHEIPNRNTCDNFSDHKNKINELQSVCLVSFTKPQNIKEVYSDWVFITKI